MKDLLLQSLSALIGFSGGLAVGSGFVAFITVLDLIPRLAQIAGTRRTASFEAAVVAGVLFFTMADFWQAEFGFFIASASAVGLFCGVFVGMLAAALTEVLNVFPILAKRLGLHGLIHWLLMAMVLGKVAGSLFDWLVFQQWKE